MTDSNRNGSAHPALEDTKTSPQRLTLSHVAADAGVSRSTVSLVLRNSPLVAANTRARVQASIDKLGYVYNRGAASLRTQRSNTIGLLITDITNSYFAELTAGVEERLDAAGYVALFANSSDIVVKQERLLATLQEHQVDGVLLCPARSTSPKFMSEVCRQLPVVLVVRHLAESANFEEQANVINADYVGADDVRGGELAAAHLLGQGHRRIAFVGGPTESSARRDRIAGYRIAHQKQGVPVDETLLFTSEISRTGGYQAVAEMLRLQNPPTAALCYNDVVAFGLMLGLQAAGRSPGEDFAVVGFDDIAEASLWQPRLTTISLQPRQIGKEAADLLLERIRNPATKSTHRLLPVELIVRASCCAVV